MDSNRRVQSFLTSTNINGVNCICRTEGLFHPFHNIFAALKITSDSDTESESDSEKEIVTKPEVQAVEVKTVEVKTVEVKTVEVKTVGTQYSIKDFDDWIFIKDKNS
jgi:hypothetical protein